MVNVIILQNRFLHLVFFWVSLWQIKIFFNGFSRFFLEKLKKNPAQKLNKTWHKIPKKSRLKVKAPNNFLLNIICK